MASGALAPERPMSRGLLKNTMLGLVLGLIIVVGGVFAVEYFREPAKKSPDPRPEHDAVVESIDRRGQAQTPAG